MASPLRRPLPLRRVRRMLRAWGWQVVRHGKGDHVIWEAPCGFRMPLPGRGASGSRLIGDPYLQPINFACGLRPSPSRARRSGRTPKNAREQRTAMRNE